MNASQHPAPRRARGWIAYPQICTPSGTLPQPPLGEPPRFSEGSSSSFSPAPASSSRAVPVSAAAPMPQAPPTPRPLPSAAAISQRFRDGALEDALCCPITMVRMVDPVIAGDGHTYERSALLDWLAEHTTSPLTNQTLHAEEIRPNFAMRGVLEALASRHSNPSTSRNSGQASEDSEVYVPRAGQPGEPPPAPGAENLPRLESDYERLRELAIALNNESDDASSEGPAGETNEYVDSLNPFANPPSEGPTAPPMPYDAEAHLGLQLMTAPAALAVAERAPVAPRLAAPRPAAGAAAPRAAGAAAPRAAGAAAPRAAGAAAPRAAGAAAPRAAGAGAGAPRAAGAGAGAGAGAPRPAAATAAGAGAPRPGAAAPGAAGAGAPSPAAAEPVAVRGTPSRLLVLAARSNDAVYQEMNDLYSDYSIARKAFCRSAQALVAQLERQRIAAESRPARGFQLSGVGEATRLAIRITKIEKLQRSLIEHMKHPVLPPSEHCLDAYEPRRVALIDVSKRLLATTKLVKSIEKATAERAERRPLWPFKSYDKEGARIIAEKSRQRVETARTIITKIKASELL